MVFAEAVTLAHAGRSFALAHELHDANIGEVGFACAPLWNHFLGPPRTWYRPIRSISPDVFMDRLHSGRPAYLTGELEAYVRQDEEIIDAFRPDVVVGDFRISLAASARRCKVPYIALTNAYWSPAARPRFIVPDIPPTRLLGPALAQQVVPFLVPLFFAFHSLKINQFKRRLGLAWWELDLRKVYGDADYLWYVDLPGMVPIEHVPARDRYIGWIGWSPEVPLPDRVKDVPRDRPVIYVSLGSSGPSKLLPVILRALGSLPVSVIAAGVDSAGVSQPNVFGAPTLPGDAVLPGCAVAVCNGGSPSVQQALVHGVPVLGIPRNLDQYLNMHYVEESGAGLMIRSDELTPGRLTEAVRRLVRDPAYLERAGSWATRARAFPRGEIVRSFLAEILN